MARDNIIWGEERIAQELLLKLGIELSPRTVRKYMPKRPPRQPRGDQRWLTFIRNHAKAIAACDFLTVVTATFREAIPSDHTYHYLLHDRDNIFSADLDRSIKKLGLQVLKSPYRSPRANSICERVIGSLRRECLDFLIPFTQAHLLRIVNEWTSYYNTVRPHRSLGPGIPSPPDTLPVTASSHRHRLADKREVFAYPVLGGLHHDYRLLPVAL